MPAKIKAETGPRLPMADRAPRSAWLLTWLGYGFWLLGVNGFCLLDNANRHGARRDDPATGQTHLLINHGDHRWIQPQAWDQFQFMTNVAGVGYFVVVVALMAIYRGAVMRYLVCRRWVFLPPLILAGLSSLLWNMFGR